MVVLNALLLSAALGAPADVELLHFTAPNCAACQSAKPVVERLVRQGYPVRTIDISREPQLAARYQVDRAPTFVMTTGGHETERLLGATPYPRLLRMYGAARSFAASSPNAAAPNVAATRNPPAVRETAGVVLPAADSRWSPTSPAAAAQANFPRRGQTQFTTSNSAPNRVNRALAASVRLYVNDPQGRSIGSGVIIDTHGNEALIVTCGHLFRDSQGKGAIQVDFNFNGQQSSTPGQLVVYNLERDIALVAMRPGTEVLTAPVASSVGKPTKGARAFSVGCDHGAAPSVQRTQIIGIDKYEWPPNIEAAGEPVDGRSGGGLFSADGRLIGICKGAVPSDNEGIYASLETIHWQLAQLNLQHVFQPTDKPKALATRQQPRTSDSRSLGQPAKATLPSDTEVLVIVRPRNGDKTNGQVLLLERPSAELIERLLAEASLRNTAPAADIADARRLVPVRPVIRAQSRDN